ncbi:disease resistance-like protein CSA1 isoform X2 [Prunus avium]|uniref:Disease resistance-like protein CSA1 isoform X2 n=1 Tax=Prunus avium TaxID=42229 RepID=A0A6P5U4X2_PRUAV|nr:disease resistance-like protein CSA1 isoform X2 [Prunus avium]
MSLPIFPAQFSSKGTSCAQSTSQQAQTTRRKIEVFLTEIPDLSSIPNLKYLYALYCSNLVEVHPSVGYLGKLEVLDLSGCPRLAKFPKKVRWKSLKHLLLSFCKMFESFPEVVDKMEFICELNLDGTAVKELPSSIGHLTGLTTLSLCYTPLKELSSSIGYLTALERLALQGCRNITNLPESIYGLQHLEVLDLNFCPKLTLRNNLNSEVLSSVESLPLEVLTNSNISHDNFGSLAFPELQYVYFEDCNLLDIDFLENFGGSSELHRMVLCKNNFISLPVCISKFVKLRQLDLSCCKMLREIVQLPPNIEEIDVGDCISLERFSALEDGDMQLIRVMDMCNCRRLCDNLYVSKIANILLNQMKKYKIEVKLPGSEVPEWFSCRKDVGVLLNQDYGFEPYSDDICELVVEIPRAFKWENAKLVLCAVFENCCGGSYNIEAGVTIDGVDTYNDRFSSRKIDSAHVWLQYIPLADYFIEPNVNDKESDDQLKKSYLCRVTFSYGGERLLFKSCGAHLADISMPKDGDDGKNDENELDDDDVGDEVRPRKRKKYHL